MEPESYDYLFKVVLVGGEKVGKTAILNQFTSGTFKTEHRPTIGVDFGTKVLQVDDKKVRVQIWDTASQEKYRSITKAYFKGARIVLFVYDITNKDSIQRAKDLYEESKTGFAEDTIVGVLGNKNDRQESKMVTDQDAEKLAQEIGGEFCGDVCCIASSDQIDEVMMKLLRKVIANSN